MFNHPLVEGKWTCKDIEELELIADDLIARSGDTKVWIFDGELGAGKTTLIQVICRRFGVIDRVSSPTFALVNEYINGDGQIFYHFDFYRIKNEREALDIGCEEYFYSNAYCFIEWGSRISSLLPPSYIRISLLVNDDNSRVISLEKYE